MDGLLLHLEDSLTCCVSQNLVWCGKLRAHDDLGSLGQALHLYQDTVTRKKFLLMYISLPPDVTVFSPNPRSHPCGSPTGAFHKYTASSPLTDTSDPTRSVEAIYRMLGSQPGCAAGSFLLWFHSNLASFHVIQYPEGII